MATCRDIRLIALSISNAACRIGKEMHLASGTSHVQLARNDTKGTKTRRSQSSNSGRFMCFKVVLRQNTLPRFQHRCHCVINMHSVWITGLTKVLQNYAIASTMCITKRVHNAQHAPGGNSIELAPMVKSSLFSPLDNSHTAASK